ncbi:MAG: hypothetical protein LBS19_11715 [Clostridiales bacterium]|jgi:hypothetical protein|nr:hypothetical protein [Clostridiales bacterium]
MLSDYFMVRDTNTPKALNRLEKLASCYGFSTRDVLRIRLLAEEIIAVIRPTFALSPARFRVSTDVTAFSVIIDCDARINSLSAETKKRLLNLGGANGKGLFGMLRKALDFLAFSDAGGAAPSEHRLFYRGGLHGGVPSINISANDYIWYPAITGSGYNPSEPASAAQNQQEADQELELKIVEGVADDVSAGIRRVQGRPRLEITVVKCFAPGQMNDIAFDDLV